MSRDLTSVVMPIPALQWGGLFGVLVALDAPLRARGYAQSVLVPLGAEAVRDRLADHGIDVHCVDLPRLRRSASASLKTLMQLPGALRALKALPVVRNADLFQAVGVHHPHAPYMSWAMNKPLIWQLHSDSVSGPFRRIAHEVITRKQDGVMANGARIGQVFLGDSFGQGNHGTFFPPVAVEQFAPDAAARQAARAALGVAEDELLVCTIGNRGWQKNHALLIEAVRRAAPQLPKLRVVIAGGDVAGFEETYRQEVLAPAEALNAERPGLISFGRIQSPQVPDRMRAADLFVLSSHSEGIPLVVAEAMAAATPVISTDVGSIAEVLPASCGRIVAPGDAGALAQALTDLGQAPEARAAMGAAALAHSATAFSAEAAADSHAAVYARALSARG